MSRLDDVYLNMEQIGKANNRFDNYKPEFSFGDMNGLLDQTVKDQGNILSKKAGNTIQRGQKDATARMASMGVTGGSVLNNAVNKVADTTGDDLSAMLEQLMANQSGQKIGLMNTANNNQMQSTQAAQNVDLQNITNQLAKWQQMGNLQMGKEQLDMQKDAQPGFLDDLMSFAGDLAPIAANFIVPGLGAVLGAAKGIMSKGAQQQPTNRLSLPGVGMPAQVPQYKLPW